MFTDDPFCPDNDLPCRNPAGPEAVGQCRGSRPSRAGYSDKCARSPNAVKATSSAVEADRERRNELCSKRYYALAGRGEGLPEMTPSNPEGGVPMELSAQLFVQELCHDAQCFLCLGQVIVIPESVRQGLEDHELGVHAGTHEGTLEDCRPAQQ